MVAWLIPAFTTTTVNDRVVAAVSVMSTLQNYFEYVCCLMCGIPKVTLLGTVEDWVPWWPSGAPFFPFLGSRFPDKATNPKKGALIIIWLLGYHEKSSFKFNDSA